jgi:ech hydrogenase subunit E
MASTVIPFGPQHPVLPEPIQLQLEVKDERVVKALPNIGYVHRGIEKAAEQNALDQNVFLVERVCGICSFMHALSYCQGVEELMGLKVPDRARYLRVVWSELHRIHSHLLWLGLYADAFGYESLFMQIWRNRERIMDALEKTAGHRVIISACQIGGVRRDLDADGIAFIHATLDFLEEQMKSMSKVFRDDKTIRHRTAGVGVLTREQAIELGAVGPMARASGIPMDLRTRGYAAYGELDFEPVVETAGDCWARGMIRVREVLQSAALVRQAIAKLPAGDIAVKPKGAPNGTAISRVEQPRGEVIYFLAASGGKQLDRLRIRTPTFANVPALVAMLPGSRFADVPVITLTIDPCISCTER